MATLALTTGACQLFLGGEDYVLDPGSGGAGGGGGASTSSGGGATSTTTTTSAGGAGGEGGQAPQVTFETADELVTRRGALLDLAISGTKLFYLVDGSAAQGSHLEAFDTTSDTTSIHLAGLTEPRGVAVDATHVYTTTGPVDASDTLCHVVRTPLAGGASEDLQTATVVGGAGANANCYVDVSVGGARVFASLEALAQFGGRAHVRSSALPSGSSVAAGRAANDAVPIPAVFASGSNVFWVDRASGELQRASGTNSINNLGAGNPPGPGVSTVAQGLANASDVAVRLDVAYTLSEAGVHRVPALGGVTVPTNLNADVAAPRGISVDATHVYWADATTRQVRAISIAGGQASVLLWQPENETPVDTVATGAAIFVITAEGTVARIDKSIQ